MQGVSISNKYQAHTIRGIIALPVEEFIMTKRTGDDLTLLNGKLGDRPIIATLQDDETQEYSSTTVKKALKEGSPIDTMISERVKKIIEENQLYQE